jgi:CRISPR-associated protein Cas2
LKTSSSAHFNIGEQDLQYISPKKVYCLVIYDISLTRRRNKLVKILKGYGARVQKSAFDLFIGRTKFDKLIKDIDKFYDAQEFDQIRVYRFGGALNITIWGDEIVVKHEDLVFL